MNHWEPAKKISKLLDRVFHSSKTLKEKLPEEDYPQLGGGRSRMVNLGCGTRYHPDWINIDSKPQSAEVTQHDIRQPLPFSNSSCAVVYSSHVLEHLSRSSAKNFLREFYRILVPGGVFRIVVPDLETIVKLYLRNLEGALAGDQTAALRYEWITLELLDQMVRDQSGGEMLKYWQQNPMPAEDFVIERMGQEVLEFRKSTPAFYSTPDLESVNEMDSHKVAKFRGSGEVHRWMYDRYSLKMILTQIGFHQIRQCRGNESRIPDFGFYTLDVNQDGTIRKPDSLFMEAVKPVT